MLDQADNEYINGEDRVMKFNSQICTTKEQSERLLALGLKKETADMMFIVLVKDFRGEDVPNAERVYSLCCWYEETSMSVGLEKREYIPAWSLHRTSKGDSVDFRWLGESNGCYSESVDIEISVK